MPAITLPMKSMISLRTLGLLFSLAILGSNLAQAQTTLGAGDIVFTMYNSGANSSTTVGDHRFSFVTLVDLAPSTVIYFTDVGMNGNAFQTTASTRECFLQYTTTGTVAKGSQISIGNTAGSTVLGLTATGGTVTLVSTALTSYSGVTGSVLGISATGDQLFAYQASSFDATATIVAGINGNNGGWTSTTGNVNESSLPPSLSNGTNALDLSAVTSTFDVDTAQFNFAAIGSSLPSSNTKAGWLAIINNVSNWTVQTSAAPFADSSVNLTISAIPEPHTYTTLVGSFVLGLAMVRRFKRH